MMYTSDNRSGVRTRIHSAIMRNFSSENIKYNENIRGKILKKQDRKSVV